MRVPLSWLQDFAPIEGDRSSLSAALDDLGLVVEGVEILGEGLGDVIVARVDEISAIDGADKIRRVIVEAGAGPVEVVCGAWNFGVGDLVALAPVGAVLPGDFAIGKRKMKGVTSNGMLCSGRELRLSEDHDGILVMNDRPGAVPGALLVDVLGIEEDIVFDIAVEANRPDAWCVAGVARDLAARLGVPFAVPPTSRVAEHASRRSEGGGPDSVGDLPVGPKVSDQKVSELASLVVEDLELCPRMTVRVLTGVRVTESPEWLARRLIAAGMRPINNVVDASNYVMLELGQPTHPYDLDRLTGGGLTVRRATPGEMVTTLDGVERTLGRPGPGLGDTGQDCLICDATGQPVGIGGIMGGASSEITSATTRVLLEAAYFVPMAIARTSKRLALRTEASARFERGCDPEGIDRAAERFCELVALTGGGDLEVADGVLEAHGAVPEPLEVPVRPDRVNALLGTAFTSQAIADLLAPLGMTAVMTESGDQLLVTVPTFRPDVRPAPMGEADLAEEVGRTFGYSRLPRRQPAWPQPGRLSRYQRQRRQLRDVLCGLGASEAWTTAFWTESDLVAGGSTPPFVEVANPLVDAERYLRTTLAPGLVRAVAYNAERRQGDVRLFEVGMVFAIDDDADGTARPDDSGVTGAVETERLSAVFCAEGDDAWSAVAAWHTVAETLGLAGWKLDQRSDLLEPIGGVHPHRSGVVISLPTAASPAASAAPEGIVVGVVGELDPGLVESFGLVGPDGRPRPVGWLDLDLPVLFDHAVVERRPLEARPVSRFPSSDVDLAFVVPEAVPAGAVEATLVKAGGSLVEAAHLFDVYRGQPLEAGSRSLAYRLRFCADDRTLTDEEVGGLRAACIRAVETAHGATLR